jgi:hypothetical protein
MSSVSGKPPCISNSTRTRTIFLSVALSVDLSTLMKVPKESPMALSAPSFQNWSGSPGNKTHRGALCEIFNVQVERDSPSFQHYTTCTERPKE